MRRACIASRAIAVWWLLVTFWSCDSQRASLTNDQPRDSTGISIVDHGTNAGTTWRLDSVPLLEIGGADGGGTSAELFGVVAARRLGDGRIIVAEGSPPRLLSFNGTGELLRTVGERGAGPGEFQSIAWMQFLANDSLLVYDPRLMRATLFTDSLQFATTLTPERPQSGTGGVPALVGTFGDRTLLSASKRMVPASPRGEMIRPRLVLFSHDATGAIVDSLTTTEGDEAAVLQGIIVQPPFARRTQIVVGPDAFFIATGDEFEVLAYDQSGKLRIIFRRAVEALPVTEADMARFRLADQLELRGKMTYPSIGAVLLDDDGNIWAEEFHRDPKGGSDWVVFGSAGRLVSAAHLPSGFRPLHIGSDFALGVWRNEMGVESIRLHRLINGLGAETGGTP